MSKKVKFYYPGLKNENMEIINYNMADLFNAIDEARKNELIKYKHVISGKSMKVFKFIRPQLNPDKNFIIPFGTLKQGAVYEENEEDGEVTELTSRLYDITFLYYNMDDKVCFITSDSSSPTVKNISEYMNCLLDSTKCFFYMKPLSYSVGLTEVKKAKLVRNIIISLDLGLPTIEKFISLSGTGLLSSLQNITQESGKANVKRLNINLGVDKSKKSTMNTEQVMLLLSSLNLDDDIIKEITVLYKNNEQDKINMAKLKDSYILLNYEFNNSPGKNLTSSFIIENAEKALDQKRLQFAPEIRKETFEAVSTHYQVFDFLKDINMETV